MSAKTDPKALKALRIGILSLIVGVLLLLAMLLWGTLAEGSPGLIRLGTALGVLIMVAAAGILAYSRQVRRRHRPEWLETQAWRHDLQDKLKQKSGPGQGS